VKFIIVFFLLFSNFFIQSYAQESTEENLEAEVSDDDFLSEDSSSELSDEEFDPNEYDEPVTDEVETKTAQDQTQDESNTESESGTESNSDTDGESEKSTNSNSIEEKNELTFATADSYQTFGEKTYDWSAYLHYGFAFSNFSDDFTFTDPLPGDYKDIGLDLFRHIKNKRYFWGVRLQMLTESVETSTVKAEYSLNLLTPLVGYKIFDDIVSVSAVLGWVMPLNGSSTVSTVSGSGSVDKTLKPGFSYTVGLVSIVRLKRFHVGFDGGLLYLNDMELDGADFDSSAGGYFRGMLGIAF